jgi:hypothetical protein
VRDGSGETVPANPRSTVASEVLIDLEVVDVAAHDGRLADAVNIAPSIRRKDFGQRP